MWGALLLLCAAQPAETRPQGAVLEMIVETALAQVKSIDRAWHEDQRDCAGLVRYAYRTAFAKLGKQGPLFVDAKGNPSHFADAETLVMHNFAALGRGDDARRELRSGDLIAFRSDRGGGEVVWHLMLVVVPAPSTEVRVVYHPGERDARVRTGTLASLLRDAPLEWRPVVENPSFLGFFRFKAFMHRGGPM